MVSDDCYGMLSPLEVLLPFLQSKYDHKEFLVIDVVVLLGSGESTGKVGA